ncbi:MAG: FAD:protein FMN transferase [Gemmatimonadota bacterium]
MRLLRTRRPYVHSVHYDHVLGTSLDLRIVATTPSVAARAEALLLAEVDRLELILSGWSDSSEFARWQTTHAVDVAVSPELAEVLDMCESWRQRTVGSFDSAAQAVIQALATDDQIRVSDVLSTLARNEPRWVVDRANGTARRLTELAVSLDAIAKGFIVSSAARCARSVEGVRGVLLNIGGDVQHLGEGDVDVGVSDPFAPMDNAPPLVVVRIRNAAVATSGSYRRGFVANGHSVSHIVDPRSGIPSHRIASASVIAPDCATADALSTAFSVMAPHESVAFANSSPDIGCMLIEDDGTITTNASWSDRALRPRR